MQSTISLRKALKVFTFIFIIQSSLYSQQIIPALDEVIHLNEITELAVSLDNKYFALVDADGIVSFRDVQTGKIIATEDYDGTVEDIAFSEKEGCLVVVYTYDNETSIEHYDFIKEEELGSQSFFDLEIYGVDFSVDNNYVLLSPEEGKPLLVNYISGDTLSIPVPGDYSTSSFGPGGTCIIYNGTENDSNIEVYQYDINSQQLSKLKAISNAQGDNDLNNKLSYILENQITFEDPIKEAKLTVSVEEYLIEGETNIFDFAFSPNKKFAVIVGGNGTEEVGNRIGFNINNYLIGSGFVALYDVQSGQQIWKTSAEKFQPQFDIKDVDWISNENFILCDEQGNVFSMSIGEPYYYDAFYLPRKVYTYADISDDFSTIIYSQKDSPSYQFDINDEGNREILSKDFSNRIYIANNKQIAATGASINTNRPINDHVFGLLKSMNFPKMIYSDIDDMAFAETGSSFAISTSMKYAAEHRLQDLDVKNIINEGEKIKLIEFDQFSLLANGVEQERFFESQLSEKPGSFLVHTKPATTVFDLRGDNKPLIIQETVGDLQYSRDGKFLAIKKIDLLPNVKFLEVSNQKWFKIPGETGAIKYNHFSQVHPYALSINNQNQVIVWNTNTLEVIFKDRIEATGFSPDSPKAELVNSLMFQLDLFIENVSFKPNATEVFIQLQGNVYTLNTNNGSFTDEVGYDGFIKFKLSPDGKIIYSEEYDEENSRTRSFLSNLVNSSLIYEKPFLETFDEESKKYLTGDVFFHRSKPMAFVHNAHGSFDLLDLTANLEEDALVATLKFFENGEWVVFAPNGLFDGSKNGRNAIYYTYGTEVILFDQIKEKYWQPDLLNMLINNPDLILTEGTESGIEMYPKANVSSGSKLGDVNINLMGIEDQMGPVSLFINSKEVESDINPQGVSALKVNVLDDKYRTYLYPEGNNEISIITHNKNKSIRSRPYSVYFQSNLAKDKGEGDENQLTTTSRRRTRSSSGTKPGLYGLFVGTSRYQNEKLNLSFADKDAQDLNEAFKKISTELYDQNRVHLKTLLSETDDATELASKQNILSEFALMQAEAKPDDIIILFFSGHGLTIDDDFYYLTKTAGKTDLRTNAEEREKTCLSSSEIKEGLRKIKSNKQIMILDACHSGQITKIFEANDKATSTTLNKALENLEDKMGVYVLASSESNQKSFETETLQQGLLTFSLKYGMSGEASQDDVLDVAELLTFASTNAEEIGKKILGKSQRPVLGITQGGNPFPIGTKNPELRVELPEKKQKFSEPRFLVISNFSDPKKIEKAVKDDLMARGAIGSNSDFIYIKNELDIDAIKIAGSYSVEGTSINLEWNLIKQEKVFKGPLTLSIEEEDLDLIGKMIVKKSLKALE